MRKRMRPSGGDSLFAPTFGSMEQHVCGFVRSSGKKRIVRRGGAISALRRFHARQRTLPGPSIVSPSRQRKLLRARAAGE
jgi:hypothetical protein